MVRVQQRPAGEQVRADRVWGIALPFVEDRAEGVERSANVLIVGGHNLVRFGRKNIGEGRSSIGGNSLGDRSKGSKRCLNIHVVGIVAIFLETAPKEASAA